MKTKKNSTKLLIWLVVLGGGFWVHEFLVMLLGVRVANNGVSFGWGTGGSGLVLIVFMAYILIFKRDGGLGYWMMLVGAGVNLVDRLRFGYVRDYWLLPFTSLYNNINDWFIALGTVIFIHSLWKRRLR